MSDDEARNGKLPQGGTVTDGMDMSPDVFEAFQAWYKLTNDGYWTVHGAWDMAVKWQAEQDAETIANLKRRVDELESRELDVYTKDTETIADLHKELQDRIAQSEVDSQRAFALELKHAALKAEIDRLADYFVETGVLDGPATIPIVDIAMRILEQHGRSIAVLGLERKAIVDYMRARGPNVILHSSFAELCARIEGGVHRQ